MLNEGDCTDKEQPDLEAWGDTGCWELNLKNICLG